MSKKTQESLDKNQANSQARSCSIPLSAFQLSARFNAASNSYDTTAETQRQSAELLYKKLTNYFKEFQPRTVLDLGCGTGCMTELLLQSYPDAKYHLNDIASKMLDQAGRKFLIYNNFSYHLGDLQSLEFDNYDLIVSNLALQWSDDLEGCILKFCAKSQIFAFTCLLQGSFDQWGDILAKYGILNVIKKYPTKDYIARFCRKIPARQIHYSSKNFELKFNSAFNFMKYLKNLGAGGSSAGLSIKKLATLIKDHEQQFFITYKVFFALIKR
jgi:malonyl-CoA O-methyltransferase